MKCLDTSFSVYPSICGTQFDAFFFVILIGRPRKTKEEDRDYSPSSDRAKSPEKSHKKKKKDKDRKKDDKKKEEKEEKETKTKDKTLAPSSMYYYFFCCYLYIPFFLSFKLWFFLSVVGKCLGSLSVSV